MSVKWNKKKRPKTYITIYWFINEWIITMICFCCIWFSTRFASRYILEISSHFPLHKGVSFSLFNFINSYTILITKDILTLCGVLARTFFHITLSTVMALFNESIYCFFRQTKAFKHDWNYSCLHILYYLYFHFKILVL